MWLIFLHNFSETKSEMTFLTKAFLRTVIFIQIVEIQKVREISHARTAKGHINKWRENACLLTFHIFFCSTLKNKKWKKCNWIKELLLLQHTKDNGQQLFVFSKDTDTAEESHVACMYDANIFDSLHTAFNSILHIFRCFSSEFVWYRKWLNAIFSQ